MSKKFLITGLCMQGNKGGPAIALSLIEAIRREMPDAEFIFSVPGSIVEWPHEVKWAKKYGFRIIRNCSLSNIVPPFCFRSNRLKYFHRWWKTIRACDALIQMSAISYVGPPSDSGTLRLMLQSGRFFDFAFSFLASRKMVAWTQSYGPLSTSVIRFFARQDLRRQSLIFCRGEDCLAAVKQLLPKANAISFPDVAITLPYDKEWGNTYLIKSFSLREQFVTLSPSAVMYSRHGGEGSANQHVIHCLEICEYIQTLGFRVVVVPHTFRPSQNNPQACDFEVARILCKSKDNSNLILVEEDLSPIELKSIIANAQFHVGARYHSVVAALSAGVPVITLSWHPKYRDIMRVYGVEKYTLENEDVACLKGLLSDLDREKADLRTQLHARQNQVECAVRENARLFCELL